MTRKELLNMIKDAEKILVTEHQTWCGSWPERTDECLGHRDYGFTPEEYYQVVFEIRFIYPDKSEMTFKGSLVENIGDTNHITSLGSIDGFDADEPIVDYSLISLLRYAETKYCYVRKN